MDLSKRSPVTPSSLLRVCQPAEVPGLQHSLLAAPRIALGTALLRRGDGPTGRVTEMAEKAERSAVLVLRAWVEGGQIRSFRARIIQSSDSAGTEHTVVTTTVPDAVMTAVRAWLDSLLSDRGTPNGHIETEPESGQ
jgi:hypothetical protein